MVQLFDPSSYARYYYFYCNNNNINIIIINNNNNNNNMNINNIINNNNNILLARRVIPIAHMCHETMHAQLNTRTPPSLVHHPLFTISCSPSLFDFCYSIINIVHVQVYCYVLIFRQVLR